MCGPLMCRCLLLWTAVTSVSRTNFCVSGQVSAASTLTAYAGEPLVLGCNITIAPGNTVEQVRWLTEASQVLLAYQLGAQVQVSHQTPGVELSSSLPNASSITISRVQAADEGCYRCNFDVFPSGLQEGRTCVSVTGKVRTEVNNIAVEEDTITLTCRYSLPERVAQVLWKKAAKQGLGTTVASYSKHGGYKVENMFEERFSLGGSLGDSRLTIRLVSREDDACYNCEFHSFPDGTKQDTACLSVYVLPRPEVTSTTFPSGVTEANCTAQSRPEAKITWDLGAENQTLGPPRLSTEDGGDGTTIVTSTLIVKSDMLDEVLCVVKHPGLDEDLTVSLIPREGSDLVVPLSVCAVAAVVLLGICVCLCKRCNCTND